MFLNVVLGHKQDLTDCAENLEKENPSTRSTPLAPTRADFSEISSQELQDRAAFQRCKCHAWMPVADECS